MSFHATYTADCPLGGPESWVIRATPPPSSSNDRTNKSTWLKYKPLKWSNCTQSLKAHTHAVRYGIKFWKQYLMPWSQKVFSWVFFKWSELGAHYFLVYLFIFSTCFGQLCAHHQENLLYLCDTGIFHSVWVAVWSADETATHTHSCPKHIEKLK